MNNGAVPLLSLPPVTSAVEQDISAMTRTSDSTQIVNVSFGTVKEMSQLSMLPIWSFPPLSTLTYPDGTQNKQLDEEEDWQHPETSLSFDSPISNHVMVAAFNQ